jgi:hypothetical protein
MAMAGFTVEVARDLDTAGLRAALAGLESDLEAGVGERVVIVLSGHWVHGRHGTWLLGTEAAGLSPVMADGAGIRLDAVLALASARPGGAIVALAETTFPGDPGPGLAGGLPDGIEVPQGVTLVRGPGAQLASFLAQSAGQERGWRLLRPKGGRCGSRASFRGICLSYPRTFVLGKRPSVAPGRSPRRPIAKRL